MGHRPYVRRSQSRILPGAPREAHRRLGSADKREKGRTGPSLSSTTRVIVIVLAGRPAGTIGVAPLSIVVFLLDGWIVVGHPRPALTGVFRESSVREQPARPIDRSPSRSTTAVSDARRSASSIVEEYVDSKARGQPRAAGIPDERASRESISEFEACTRVLEEPAGSIGTPVERSSGSINEVSSSSVAAGLLGKLSIRFVKSIWPTADRIKRLTALVIDLKKRQPTIGRFTALHRLPNADARTIRATRATSIDRPESACTRILTLSIFLSESDESTYQFSQSFIFEDVNFYVGAIRPFSSRRPLTHTAVPCRAAAMTFERVPSFR